MKSIFTSEYVAEVLEKKCSSTLVGGDAKSIDDILKSVKEKAVDDVLDNLKLYHFDINGIDDMNDSNWNKKTLLEYVILPSLKNDNNKHWFSTFLADGTFNPSDDFWLYGDDSTSAPTSSNNVYKLLADFICDFYEGFDGVIYDILKEE